LLLDSRDRAGLSRAQLGSMACLSDSTIKNIEVAKHPPTRRTCLRLVGVSCLQLRWADVEAFAGPAPEGLEALETTRDAAGGSDRGMASEPEAARVAVPARHSDAPTEPASLPFLTVQIFASGRVTVDINPTAQRK
jgi:DNA-binding XRE family transcriptional regulator